MLPIHVISFRDSGERRENAEQQLVPLGLQFEFFDALRPRDGAALFDRFDPDGFIIETGRLPVSGEIGCFASHKALWQRAVEQNQPILIMEDDFRLQPGFATAVRTADMLIDDVGLLRLQDERRARSSVVAAIGDFTLERYTKPPQCAMSYAIAPWLARRLLRQNRDFSAPVDVVLKRTWEFGQPMYCLTPYVVTHGQHSGHSTIGDRHKCRKSLPVRLRRNMARVESLVHLYRFNLTYSDAALRHRINQRIAIQEQKPGRYIPSVPTHSSHLPGA